MKTIKVNNISRRTVLKGKLALCAVGGAGLAQTANALEGIGGQAALTDDMGLRASPVWATANAADFKPFYAQSFWGIAEDGTQLSLQLVEAGGKGLGSGRPAILRRSEAVLLSFTSPQMEWFASNSAQTIMIGHVVLGHTNLFVSPVPKQSGGYSIEAVLT